PSINVDAAIENVGLTSDNLMDVPKYYDEAAWYQLGPRPGERGNAVISGHVDSTKGSALFWDLRKLVPGDTITVVGDDGIERRFVVTASERYTPGGAPLTRIFGAADGVHLNLITCDADTPFDSTSGAYTGYLLIYADAVA
ncbi:MAG: class F sortase, partial [Chloroflexota bacterium]|nr:class F sortase [Chloroflexota bacterium]